jgi:hypothetical protein
VKGESLGPRESRYCTGAKWALSSLPPASSFAYDERVAFLPHAQLREHVLIPVKSLFFFFVVLGLELRAYILSYSASSFL